MAHAVETMAYAGEVPWHGLGKQVLPDLTPEQMLYEAGLDWSVEKIPAMIKSWTLLVMTGIQFRMLRHSVSLLTL